MFRSIFKVPVRAILETLGVGGAERHETRPLPKQSTASSGVQRFVSSV